MKFLSAILIIASTILLTSATHHHYDWPVAKAWSWAPTYGYSNFYPVHSYSAMPIKNYNWAPSWMDYGLNYGHHKVYSWTPLVYNYNSALLKPMSWNPSMISGFGNWDLRTPIIYNWEK